MTHGPVAVAVMAKAPGCATVTSRLQPPLTADAASMLRPLIPPGVRLLAQRGEGLGERPTALFDWSLGLRVPCLARALGARLATGVAR